VIEGKRYMMIEKDVIRYDFGDGTRRIETEMIAVERPISIRIGGKRLSTLLASPEMEKELLIGHMLSQGLIESVDSVEKIQFADDDNIEVILAGDFETQEHQSFSHLHQDYVMALQDVIHTRKGPLAVSDSNIKAERVPRMLKTVKDRGTVYKATRSAHSAALFTRDGELVSFAEDVSRHCAIYKVIGSAGLKRATFPQLVLVSSARQSASLVLKAARVGIPIIIAMAHPMESGLRVAEATGITVAYFRKKVLKIYTFPERIDIDSPSASQGSQRNGRM
jgi:FdhD protein